VSEEPAAPDGPEAPRVKSEEALARSKEEVTPAFKTPKAPKPASRWPAGRTIRNRPSK
jgi:hypothetical protein